MTVEAPDLASFRAELRAFLEAHAPRRGEPQPGGDGEPHAQDPDGIADWRTWQRTLAEHGWAAPTWPKEHGGRDATSLESRIFHAELGAYDVPSPPTVIGLGLVGPTLMVHGTRELQTRHLPRILCGDEIWCQLWSEPNAGSDVASLATRADRVPGGWVLNGQKVWTSGAHLADYGICIARTDFDLPKHQGITCFIVDMHASGVTPRPLHQITGRSHFNEVFLEDVFVSDERVVGEVNDGWRVAITVLMNERNAITSDARNRKGDDIIRLARSLPQAVRDDPVLRQHVVGAWIRSRILELVGARVQAGVVQGRTPGPEGSIGKLLRSQANTETVGVALRLLGAQATLTSSDAGPAAEWVEAFLNAPALRIAGGTDEIQRNIIGERVLGLPKEPQVDREVPFRQVLRARPR